MGTIATATNLTLNSTNQTLTDSVNLSTPDYYKIALTALTNVNFRASNLSGNVNLSIVDADSNQIKALTSRNTGNLAENINTTLQAGTYYVQVASDSATNANYTLDYAGTSAFNSDILFRHQSGLGENAYWKMSGSTFTGNVSYFNSLADPNWQIKATGDFSGDGQNDIVLQNTSDGQIAIWGMENNALSYGDFNINPGSAWNVVGAGDFNGDSKADLFLNNTSTGESAIYYLDGTRRISPIAAEYSVNPGTNWKAEAVGDFNGDGRADAVWREQNGAGRIALWYMDGNKVTSSTILSTTVSDQGWQIMGSGDYNNDGKADLLWRYAANGQVASWQMNGATLSSATTIAATSDTGWNVTAGYTRTTKVDTAGSTLATAFSVGTISSVLTHGKYSGTIGTSNPTDIYKFTVASAQVVPIGIDSTTTSRVKLELLNSSGALIVSTDNGSSLDGNLGNPTITQPLAVGDYYLRVTSMDLSQDGASYVVNLNKDWAQFYNFQSGVSTTTLNTAGSTVGSNGDFYKLDLSSKGILNLNLSGLSADADLRIANDKNLNGLLEQGEFLNYNPSPGTTGESLRTMLDPGSYFLWVKPVSVNAAYNLSASYVQAGIDGSKQYMQLVFDQSTMEGFSAASRNTMIDQAKFWESAVTEKTAISTSNAFSILVKGSSLAAGTYATGSNNPVYSSAGINNLQLSGGEINLNTSAAFNPTLQSNFSGIFKHELGHTLGIGTAWEPYQFTDGVNIFSAGFNLVNRSNSTYLENTYAGVAYGKLIGTSNSAIPIEPNDFAHWRESVFDKELMTPTAETAGVGTPLSEMSLSSLRDTGWSINLGAADFYAI